jgi:hypothetical protein
MIATRRAANKATCNTPLSKVPALGSKRAMMNGHISQVITEAGKDHTSGHTFTNAINFFIPSQV